MWTVRRGTAPSATDFKTAIAFYPGCRLPLARDSWAPRLPLKIMMGSADDWTAAAAVPRPGEQTLVCRWSNIRDAYHGFDSPGVPVRVMKGLAFTAHGNGEAAHRHR